MNNRKVWISGFTGAAKTTFSNALGRKYNIPVIHGDDYIDNTDKNNFATMPHILIDLIRNKESYIIEMTQVSRMCRKIDELGLDMRPTEYYYLTEVFKELTPKQISYNKSINTVQIECNKILEKWGIDIIFELPEKKSENELDNSNGWT